MSKIAIHKRRDNNYIITNKLKYPETINVRLIDEISNGRFPGFVPVSIVEMGKKSIIECSLSNVIPLKKYLKSNRITKKIFWNMLEMLADMFKRCEDAKLTISNFDFHEDMLFMDITHDSLVCIYWPVVNLSNNEHPIAFLERITRILDFDESENMHYVEEYVSFIEKCKPFSVNALYEFIAQKQGREIKKTVAAYEHPISSPASSKSIGASRQIQANNIAYDPFAASIEPANTSQNGVLSAADFLNVADHIKEEVQEKVEKPQEVVKAAEPDYEVTVALSRSTSGHSIQQDIVQPMKKVTLTLARTGQSVIIDKPIFVLGKKAEYCDWAVDNKFVSRRHAYITNRDDKFYIVDMNSANYTYVDGVMLEPETEMEIIDGSEIMLADEVFLFEIK